MISKFGPRECANAVFGTAKGDSSLYNDLLARYAADYEFSPEEIKDALKHLERVHKHQMTEKNAKAERIAEAKAIIARSSRW